MKVIVGITGATGAIIGIEFIKALKDLGVETHLILSSWAKATINLETSYSVKEIQNIADFAYSNKDQGARVSSGSFQIDAMVVVPCSMKTLASIRHGLADNLISRSADVILKENKKLVLVTRETPLSTIHLDNMLQLSKMGVGIFPPVLTFYNNPEEIKDIVNHTVYRLIDQLDIENDKVKRWNGLKDS